MAKMKLKTKGIIKKVALALAGIVALTAVGFGVKAIVDYTKNDLKTIHLSYDVGNLGSDGKYVADESTLYTKEAFACDGLQIKLDFDNQINYQIFYYDDLDNFIESTEILSEAYSGGVHDSFARLVIIPTNDEDDKIGLIEKVTYPSQMTIKVSKNQGSCYFDVFNKRLRVVDNISSMRFDYSDITRLSDGNYIFTDSLKYASTSRDVLSVKSGYKLNFDNSRITLAENMSFVVYVYELKAIDGVLSLIKLTMNKDTFDLDEQTTHIVIKFTIWNSQSSSASELSSDIVSTFNGYLSLTKN